MILLITLKADKQLSELHFNYSLFQKINQVDFVKFRLKYTKRAALKPTFEKMDFRAALFVYNGVEVFRINIANDKIF